MEADGKHSKKPHCAARRPGRPFKVPFRERLKWVVTADEAKDIALTLARMQPLSPRQEEKLVKLPTELKFLVVFSWGRHSRYLNAVALRSARAPALDDWLRRLIPTESDTTDEQKRRASEQYVKALVKYRREHFGKHVDPLVPLGLRIHIDQPSYVGGLWRDIDQWVADHLDISLSTFRSWRRRLVGQGLLQPHGRQNARRRSGLGLMIRLA